MGDLTLTFSAISAACSIAALIAASTAALHAAAARAQLSPNVRIETCPRCGGDGSIANEEEAPLLAALRTSTIGPVVTGPIPPAAAGQAAPYSDKDKRRK